MEITRTSGLTGKTHTRFIPGLTEDAIKAWQAGAFIQDAMPNISPDDREFIKTGITPEEWTAIIGDEE